MIRPVQREELAQCAALIRASFLTVAEEFGFTAENAPRFTAFAVTEKRLWRQMAQEHRTMYGCFEGEGLIGFYSLHRPEAAESCELNNLCVRPDSRHKGIGALLLESAFENARKMGCTQMEIGIVEENRRLRAWYEVHGSVHTGTKNFDFFPFICGYMRKEL